MAKKKNRKETEEEKFDRISKGNYETFDVLKAGSNYSSKGGNTTTVQNSNPLLNRNVNNIFNYKNNNLITNTLLSNYKQGVYYEKHKDDWIYNDLGPTYNSVEAKYTSGDWLNKVDTTKSNIAKNAQEYNVAFTNYLNDNPNAFEEQNNNYFAKNVKPLFEEQEPAFQKKNYIVADYNFRQTEEGKQYTDKQRELNNARAYYQSNLEQSMAKEDVKNAGPFMKAFYSIYSGIADLGSSLRTDLETSDGTRGINYGEALRSELSASANNTVERFVYSFMSELSKQGVVSALEGARGLGQAVRFLDATDDAYHFAKRSGASDGNAATYAATVGSLDFMWNKIFSDVAKRTGGDVEKGPIGEMYEKLFGSILKNKTAVDMASTFMSEGTEEWSQEYIERFWEHLILEVADKGEEFGFDKVFNEETWKNSLESFMIGGLIGDTFEGANKIAKGKANRTYDQVIFNYEKNNQKLSEQNQNLIAGMIGEYQEKLNRTPNANEIEAMFEARKVAQVDTFKENAVKLYTNLDDVSREQYNNLVNDVGDFIYNTGINVEFDPNLDTIVEWKNNNTLLLNPAFTDTPIKTLLEATYGADLHNSAIKETINNLVKDNRNTKDAEFINNLSKELNLKSIDVLKQKAKDIIEPKEYLDKNNQKIKYNTDVIKKMDILSKILNRSGITEYEFTNNEMLEKQGLTQKGKVINGYYDNGKIVINVDSNNAINRIIGHELTHSLENSEYYEQFRDAIYNYAKNAGKYDEYRSKIEDLYKKVKNADIDQELTSELAADYLFTNKEFITDLANNHTSLFTKVFNFIKRMYNKIRGNKEQIELEDQLRNAYNLYKSAFNDVAKTGNIKKSDIELSLNYDVKEEDSKPYITTKNGEIYIDGINEHDYVGIDSTWETGEEAFTRPLKEFKNAEDYGKDNDGKVLSDDVKDFNKNSHAVDAKGALLRLYHTNKYITEPFTEFKPAEATKKTGEVYQYDDDTVAIFLTPSALMSGSYGTGINKITSERTYYYWHDPKVYVNNLNSEEDVNNFISDTNLLYPENVLSVKKLKNGTYEVKQERSELLNKAKEIKQMNEYTGLADSAIEKVANERFDDYDNYKMDMSAIYDDTLMKDTYKFLDDLYKNQIKQKGEDIESAKMYNGAKDVLKEIEKTYKSLDSSDRFHFVNFLHYDKTYKNDFENKVFNYKNEKELSKKLKWDLGNFNNNDTYIYEVYANITNPFIYDFDSTWWGNAYNDLGIPKTKADKLMNEFTKDDEQIRELKNTVKDIYKQSTNDENVDFALEIENKVIPILKERLNMDSISYKYQNQYYFDTDVIEDISNELYNIAKYSVKNPGFNDFNEIIKNGFANIETNDIVRYVLEQNKNGANFDGVIMKNVIDYGGQDLMNEYKPKNDLFVAFNSNQVKSVYNEHPTESPDIDMSLSDLNQQNEIGNFNVYGKDIKIEKEPENPLVKPIKEKTQPKKTKQKKSVINEKNVKEVKSSLLDYLPARKTPTESDLVKERQAYNSVIDSPSQTKEAKSLAKKLVGVDTFVPDTNKAELERADKHIGKYGTEATLKMLRQSTEAERNNVDDIATGLRLMEYYTKIGDEERAMEALQLTAIAGTNVGRATQAMSLLSRMTPLGQAVYIQRIVNKYNKEMQKIYDRSKNPKKKLQQFDFTEKMQQKIINSSKEDLEKNVNEVYKELGSQVEMSTLEKLDTWRYFAMLSSPSTHFRNIIVNLTMGKVQGVKNKIKGGLEDLYYGITGNEGERTSTLKMIPKEYKQFSKNDLNNPEVINQLGIGENKYTNAKSQLQQNMRMFKSDLLEKTVKKIIIDKLTFGSLAKEDVWGLKAAYKKSLSQYLYANNIDLDKMSDSQLARARNYAIEQAKEATFHQYNAFASALDTLEKKSTLGKVAIGGLVPFKKTPLNILSTAAQYNPVNLVKTILFDTSKVYNGKMTANQYIDNIAKGLTGSAISVLGYALASAGIIQASGDDDDEDYDKDRGSQPYSLVLGDKTFTLDWLSPSAVPLFVGAEYYNYSHQNSKSEEEQRTLLNSALDLTNATMSSLNPITEMTMISGLSSALRSYNQTPDKMAQEIGTNTIKSYVNQLVPSVLGKIAKSTDEYERSTSTTGKSTVEKAIESVINQTKSKIPGLRQTLPKKTDVWGNEIKSVGSDIENPLLKYLVVKGIYNLASPSTVKQTRNTELDKEIQKVFETTGKKSVLPKTYISKEINIGDKKYRLTNQEYATYKQAYGQENYKKLSELIKSDAYKKLNGEQKAKVISEIYSFDSEGITEAYAKEHNIKYEGSDNNKTARAVEQLGGNAGEYFIYRSTIDKNDSDYDEKRKLKESGISKTSKSAIYEASAKKGTLDLYKVLKESDIDIDAYLDYLSNEFKADYKSNGTLITGSKKEKVYDYMNSVNGLTLEQKMLILGKEYALSNTEKDYVVKRIYVSDLTKEEKEELYKSISWITVGSNGTVRW